MSYVCKNDDFPRAFLPKKGRIRAAPADTQTRSVYLQTMISSFDTKDTSEKEEAVKGDRGAAKAEQFTCPALRIFSNNFSP